MSWWTEPVGSKPGTQRRQRAPRQRTSRAGRRAERQANTTTGRIGGLSWWAASVGTPATPQRVADASDRRWVAGMRKAPGGSTPRGGYSNVSPNTPAPKRGGWATPPKISARDRRDLDQRPRRGETREDTRNRVLAAQKRVGLR